MLATMPLDAVIAIILALVAGVLLYMLGAQAPVWTGYLLGTIMLGAFWFVAFRAILL